MKHVVILGGGYGGLYAARTLERALHRELDRDEVSLKLISRENFHVFHGFVAQMLTGTIGPTNILSPLRRVLHRTELFVAEVEQIDFEQREVVASRAIDRRQFRLPFDHLVVGLGSEDRLDHVPGLRHHGFRLKSYADCLTVRNHLLDMLELAEVEEELDERRRLLTFVIAGGGYAGVEVAAELSSFLARAHRDWPRVRREDARVVLVHSRSRILPEVSERLVPLAEYAQQRLREKGVELKLETRLASTTPEEAVLSNGERIPTRTIISTVGMTMPHVLTGLDCAYAPDGRIAVASDLSVPGLPGLWAVGDCAAVPHPRTGAACPPTAIFAMRQGALCGRNIARTLCGQPTRPFAFAGLGEAASLGGRDAIGALGPLRVRGWVAWLLRGMIFKHFVPSVERRVRIVLDWLVKSLFHRDIVLVRSERAPVLSYAHYEPGQVVLRAGNIGHNVYVILRGQVEVIREDNGVVKQTATLGPGQHFGLEIGDALRRGSTVRCTTATDLLCIGRHAHEDLQAVSAHDEHNRDTTRSP